MVRRQNNVEMVKNISNILFIKMYVECEGVGNEENKANHVYGACCPFQWTCTLVKLCAFAPLSIFILLLLLLLYVQVCVYIENDFLKKIKKK